MSMWHVGLHYLLPFSQMMTDEHHRRVLSQDVAGILAYCQSSYLCHILAGWCFDPCLLPTSMALLSEVDVFSGIRLFVSLSMCLFVRTITSEWSNVGWWNLAVRYIVPKSCRSRMSRSKVKVTRNKKWKTAKSSPLTVHSRACAVDRTQQAATDDTIVWPPRGDGLCWWENQCMLSSLSVSLSVCYLRQGGYVIVIVCLSVC